MVVVLPGGARHWRLAGRAGARRGPAPGRPAGRPSSPAVHRSASRPATGHPGSPPAPPAGPRQIDFDIKAAYHAILYIKIDLGVTLPLWMPAEP